MSEKAKGTGMWERQTAPAVPPWPLKGFLCFFSRINDLKIIRVKVVFFAFVCVITNLMVPL